MIWLKSFTTDEAKRNKKEFWNIEGKFFKNYMLQPATDQIHSIKSHVTPRAFIMPVTESHHVKKGNVAKHSNSLSRVVSTN